MLLDILNLKNLLVKILNFSVTCNNCTNYFKQFKFKMNVNLKKERNQPP